MSDSGERSRWRRFRRWFVLGDRTLDEAPQCHYCRHWRDGACPAYPGGIPLVILTNQIDHRTTGFPLDRGLRFSALSVEADAAQRALFDSSDGA